MKIYNNHIHTFTEQDVPRRFLPLHLVRILSTKKGFRTISSILNNINPFSSKDMFSKYAKFAATGKLGSQEAIFLQCKEQYPDDTVFMIIAVDMSMMNAGKVPRPYQEQLDELFSLTAKYPDNIVPFIHIDPNSKGYFKTFMTSVHKGLNGVKLYPPASLHLPSDERLAPVYQYCNEKHIPVISHCGPQSPTYYRASRKYLRKKLDEAGLEWTREMKKDELAAQFCHPHTFIPMLEKYPNINFCLGHWGSSISWYNYLNKPKDKDNWFVIISEMLKKYPNCYTDISFTLYNREFFPLLKTMLLNEKIREKVLFGSDYYMVEVKTCERHWAIDLRAYLGEMLWEKITYFNPRKYLNNSNDIVLNRHINIGDKINYEQCNNCKADSLFDKDNHCNCCGAKQI